MQYTKLSVAGCAALMFGLLACSGEDGKDGINGVNGLNGADGASCEVKSLKDGSGYKILCGGDSVGVLLNGKNGATGKQGITGATGAKGDTGKTGAKGDKGDKGDGCSVAALSDNSGYDVYCGANKVGVIKNGTDGKDGDACTTQAADDGIVINCGGTLTKLMNGIGCSGTTVNKDGRTGIEVACGGTLVDTLWNGSNGSDGSSATGSCTSVDDGKGVVTVTCGSDAPMKMYKAVCGADPFDPEKKFCVLGKTYDLCDGKAYVVNREFCNDGVVAELCSEFKFNKTKTTAQFVTYRATTKDEFCWNGIVTPKCGGATFDENEYCGKAYDGVTDSIYKYCDKPSKLEDIYDIIGLASVVAEPEEGTEEGAEEGDAVASSSSSQSFFGNLIGKPLTHYNEEKLVEFFTKLGNIQSGVTECGIETPEKCGSKVYNAKKQFCDIRDERLYKFVTIDGRRWMAENLAFEYKLPQIDSSEGSDPALWSVVQVGGKVQYEKDAFESFEKNGTRYYTWNAAMGNGDVRKIMSEDAIAALKLNPKDAVVGACPNGWRLPNSDELNALSRMANAAEHGFEDLDYAEDVTVNFNVEFLGYYNVNTKDVVDANEAAYFWSETPVEEDERQAVDLLVTGKDQSVVNTSNKVFAFTIRCIEKLPNEGEPEGGEGGLEP
jgi:uncharacterized protein (TIGR02145 family)